MARPPMPPPRMATVKVSGETVGLLTMAMIAVDFRSLLLTRGGEGGERLYTTVCQERCKSRKARDQPSLYSCRWREFETKTQEKESRKKRDKERKMGMGGKSSEKTVRSIVAPSFRLRQTVRLSSRKWRQKIIGELFWLNLSFLRFLCFTPLRFALQISCRGSLKGRGGMVWRRRRVPEAWGA